MRFSEGGNMSVEQLFTKLREGTEQQRHLRVAKLLAFASLFCALVSVLEIVEKVWSIALADVALTVFLGCSACISYALSRKASGE